MILDPKINKFKPTNLLLAISIYKPLTSTSIKNHHSSMNYGLLLTCSIILWFCQLTISINEISMNYCAPLWAVVARQLRGTRGQGRAHTPWLFECTKMADVGLGGCSWFIGMVAEECSLVSISQPFKSGWSFIIYDEARFSCTFITHHSYCPLSIAWSSMTTQYRDVSCIGDDSPWWLRVYSLHLNIAFSRQTDPQFKHEEEGEDVVPNLEAHFTRLRSCQA